MDVAVVSSIANLGSDAVVVVPVFKGDDLSDLDEVRSRGGHALESALEHGASRGSLYEPTLLFPDSLPAILLIGAGERSAADGVKMLRVLMAGVRQATGRGYTRAAIVQRGQLSPDGFAYAAALAGAKGAYNSGVKKSSRDVQRSLEALTLVMPDTGSDAEASARRGQIVGESANIARHLVDLPPNELTPSALAQQAEQLAQQYDLQCEVLDETRLRDLGMGAILGVAAGSTQPPRVIRLQYGSDTPDLAVVGKGLTFDSGGLSLKPAEGMEWMKADMGGAAAVVGGMVAIARLAPPGISVSGYIGSTENMPGGGAMRPGDVLTAMNGETIEVLNTDAEGRLVLADVLSYAVSQGARRIVDFATLTGAAAISLGRAATLAVGAPQSWVERVVAAADEGLDRAWPMPLYEDYRRAMDSEVADIKNTGVRQGGALNAAAFLHDFTDDADWTHMDIAGTAWYERNEPFQAAGGTGVGVATIASLALQLSNGGSQ